MAAIREFLPLPPVPVVQPKLEHLSENRSAYDTLFIGSSRVYFHIAPEIFDATAAIHGVPTRSFNLGIEAMKSPENAFLWESVADLRLQNLRRVFIEVTGFDDSVETLGANWRSRYWHDWERTSLVVTELLSKRRARPSRRHMAETVEIWHDVYQHVQLFLAQTANVGRGSDLLPLVEAVPARPRSHRSLGPRGDGYLPKAGQLEGEKHDLFEQELAALQERRPKERNLPRGGILAMRAMVEQIRESGAEVYFFIAPVVDTKRFAVEKWFPDVPVLDFHDANQYPRLFDADDRYERGHYNAEGAELFTRTFAEEFVKLLASKQKARAEKERKAPAGARRG